MKLKMCTIVTVVIALVIAILSLMPEQNAQMYAAYATHFFVSVLPVLGVAAIFKYLTCCGDKKACCNNKDCKCCSAGSCDSNKGSCN